MAIERWDPFQELRSLRDYMDRLFQDNWGRLASSRPSEWSGAVPVDVAETDNTYVVRATIPGVRPEDIQINVQGNRLTLRAESHGERERQEESYVVRERRAASFYRTLTLPAPVKSEQADARYEHGVLTLTLPKAQPEKASQIKVHDGRRNGDGQVSGGDGQGQGRMIEPGSAPTQGL